MNVIVNFNNSYDHNLNSIEASVQRARTGDNVNSNNDYISHTAHESHDYLTTSILLDDNATFASSDFFEFDRWDTQHGILASNLGTRVESGITALDDALYGNGLAVIGTASTVTSFIGTSSQIENIIGTESNGLFDLDDINIGGGGPGGDNYAVTYLASPDAHWDGFDVDIEVFLDASIFYRAGFQSLLSNILNGYSYDYTGSDYNDTIEGYAMNDIFRSSLGNNMLIGNGGNDWYHLGAGSDIINDSSGYDTVQFSNASTLDWETNIYTGDIANDYIAENEIERIWGSNGNDRIVMSLSGTNVHAVQGRGGNDQIGGNARDNRLDGGAGTDSLYGYDGDDYLYGGVGNDYLEGGNDNDDLRGGNGRDFLYGQNGADILTGGAGADHLDGGDGIDIADYSSSTLGVGVNLQNGVGFYGEALGDTYVDIEDVGGSTFSDVIYGTTGSNLLEGRNGNDQLFGGAGSDILFGNRGNDSFDPGAGQDYLDGGSGFDRVSYTNSTAGVTVNLDIGYGSSGDADGDSYIRIERVTGSQFDDTITGNEFGNRLKGNGGADTIFGLRGRDLIEGKAGNDILYGGAHNDSVLGGDGNDQLFGNRGSDILNGGLGYDELTGGASADRFLFKSSLGAFGGDVIMDFRDGIDKLDVRDVFSIANPDTPVNTADSFSDFTVSVSNAYGVKIKFEAGQVIYLDDTATGITVADIDASDFIFA